LLRKLGKPFAFSTFPPPATTGFRIDFIEMLEPPKMAQVAETSFFRT